MSIIMCLAVICLSLASCGGNGGSETTTAAPDNGAESGKTYTVGIIQLMQHTALDSATQGFKDALTEKLGDNVAFNYQNAAGDPTTCSTIANQMVASNVDLIMANASPALSAAASATADIPIVGTSITSYAVALGIPDADWTGKTGFNVTGTADLAPLDQQAAMILELVPEAKTVGIIFCSGEANSRYQVDIVRAELEAKGITVNEYTFADSNDIASVSTKAVAECDAIYTPTDNQVASFAGILNEIAEPAGIPVVTGDEGTCEKAGIAVLAFSYYDIGYAAGEMAVEILTEGADPAEMEIRYVTDISKRYVKERCENLGIVVPEDYEELVIKG